MTFLTGKTQRPSRGPLSHAVISLLFRFDLAACLFMCVCLGLHSCPCENARVPASACPLLPCCFIHNRSGYFCLFAA